MTQFLILVILQRLVLYLDPGHFPIKSLSVAAAAALLPWTSFPVGHVFIREGNYYSAETHYRIAPYRRVSVFVVMLFHNHRR